MERIRLYRGGNCARHLGGPLLHLFEPKEYQKWQARPQLSSPERARGYSRAGQSGLPPCLFIVPKGVLDKDFVSRSVGDCLQLLPDGTNLDLFEIPLWGPFVHIKTDLYVPDVMPLAFTRCSVPLDDWAKRNRIYVPHVYDLFMFGDRRPYTYLFSMLCPIGKKFTSSASHLVRATKMRFSDSTS